MGNFKRSPVFGSSENLDTTLHEDTVGTVKSVLSTILSTMLIFSSTIFLQLKNYQYFEKSVWVQAGESKALEEIVEEEKNKGDFYT